MIIPIEIIKSCPDTVRNKFIYWSDFMVKNILFEKPDLNLHTYNHCERVLLYALILGHKIMEDILPELTMLAHASIFHDSRRFDDFIDKGHGERASEYYKNYCENSDLEFYECAWFIIKYHDINDEEGLMAINDHFKDERAIMLYKIFKDADALDRYRLGTQGLDKRFLRFQESISLMDFSRKLVLTTSTL